MFFNRLLGGDEKKVRRILKEYKKFRSSHPDLSEDTICRKIITHHMVVLGWLGSQYAEESIARVFKEPTTIERACAHIVTMSNPKKFGLSEIVSMDINEISRRRKELHRMIGRLKKEIIRNDSNLIKSDNNNI